MKLRLNATLRAALIAAVSTFALTSNATAATGTQTFGDTVTLKRGDEVFSGLYVTKDMTTGTASGNHTMSDLMSAVNLTQPDDFRAVNCTISVWVTKASLENDCLIFSYGGVSATSDAYGANGFFWDADAQTLRLGRGKITDNYSNMEWQESSTSSSLASAIGTGEMVNFTFSVQSARQAETPTIWVNGVSVETLDTYAGNMNGTANPMNLYAGSDVTYGNVSITTSTLTDSADIYALMGLSTEKPAEVVNYVWKGAESALWDTATANWVTKKDGTTPTKYVANEDNTVTFDTTGNKKTVTLDMDTAIGSVTVDGAAYTLDLGSHTLTTGSLVVNGEGSLALTGEGTVTASSINAAGKTINIGEKVVVQGATTASAILVGSGTYVMATGAAVTTGLALSDDWAGVVRISGAYKDMQSTINALDSANDGSRVELNGVTGWLGNNVDANIILTGTDNEGAGTALTIDNGSSGAVREFSGSVSGKGDFVYSWGNSAGSGLGQVHKFTGDVSSWEGAFKVTSNSLNSIEFAGSATEINADVIQTGNSTFKATFTNDVEVTMNGDITQNPSGGTFALNVNAPVTFNGTITADTMVVDTAGKTVTLGQTTSLDSLSINAGTLSLDSTGLSLGELIVNSDASLSAEAGSSATAAITFNQNSSLAVSEEGLTLGSGSTITFALDGGKVNFSTSAAPGFDDIIVAAGVTQTAITGIEFDGKGIATATDYLTLDKTLSHYTQLCIKGTNLVLARESSGSYWGKDKGSDIWDLDSTNWASSDTLPPADKFADGDPAYFTENGGGGTITIAEKVKAESVNVSGEKEYIFAAGSGTLTVVNSVNVGEKAKATFNISLSGETLALNVKDSGTLNVGAGQKLATTSGAVTLGNEAVLGGTGTIEAGSVVLATGGEKNHADLKDGATLKTNSISGTGVLHVMGTSHLVATDDASYSEVEMQGTSVLEIAEGKTLTVQKHLALTDDCSVSNKGTLSAGLAGDILVDRGELQLGNLDIVGLLHVTSNGVSTKATGGVIGALMLEYGSSLTSEKDLAVDFLTMSNVAESTLNVNGDLQLRETTTTKGAVNVVGATTITGAVALTSLSSGSLDLTETGSLTTTGAVDVKGAITLGRLSMDEVYLNAGSLTNATTHFEVTLEDLEALGMSAGQTLRLANVAAAHGDAGNLRINGAEYIQDSRDIIYIISQDTSTWDIILTADNAPSDYIWTNDNTTELWSDNLNWSGEQVPDSKAWAQVIDQPQGADFHTIQMDVDGEAKRFTVASNGSAKLTDVNDLTIHESLEVNAKGILGISEEVQVQTPVAKIDGTLLVAESGRLVAQQVTVTDNITTMNDAYVQAGVLNLSGGILEAADGEVAAGTINMTAGLIDVDEAAYVHTDVLNGDSDSIIYGPGVLNVDGKGGRYLGGYDQARIHVSANGDQTLAAREGLSAEGSGIVRLQYVAPASIDRVSGNGMTLVLNSPSTDCTGAPLTLTNPSAVNNGQVIVGLSAVSSAITLNTAAAPIIIQATSLNLGGSTVIVNQTETDVQKLPISTSGQTEGLVLAYLGAEDSFAAVTLSGNLFNRYYINPRLEAGRILVDLNTTHILDQIEATTYNGRAGAHMLDDAFRQIDPQMAMPTGDLAAVMNALEEGRIPRADTDRMAAAMAGASYAAMGSAFSKDVERQLRSIRNRTTSMGCAECVVNEDMPYVNAWVNAEGEFRKMNRENTLAGYTLNSWGATLGVDVDFTPRFTAGVAFSYLQGDFTSRSADMGDGDLDRMYVSAFARYNRRAWTHTFVGTFGRADASLDRTVDYGAGRYSTKGDTDGTAFGLMYEAGYTVALTEDASTCLQPVFNVLYRHSCLGGYTETGSDAALKYADAEADVVTFGLGARLQSAVGTSVFNRHTLLETRALLKLDAGDRDVTPQANFVGVGGMQKIKSSEYGAFGVEIGAGVMIPIGEGASSLFFDVSAEFRSGYSDVNGAAGYRVNF